MLGNGTMGLNTEEASTMSLMELIIKANGNQAKNQVTGSYITRAICNLKGSLSED